MSTSSITTTVTIKGKNNIKRFVSALEKAKQKKGKKIIMSRPVRTVTNEELEKMIPMIKV